MLNIHSRMYSLLFVLLTRKIRNSMHAMTIAKSDPDSIPQYKLKRLIKDDIIAQLSRPESTSCSLKRSVSDSTLPSPELCMLH